MTLLSTPEPLNSGFLVCKTYNVKVVCFGKRRCWERISLLGKLKFFGLKPAVAFVVVTHVNAFHKYSAVMDFIG